MRVDACYPAILYPFEAGAYGEDEPGPCYCHLQPPSASALALLLEKDEIQRVASRLHGYCCAVCVMAEIGEPLE